jgi:hypothetical protein
MNEHENEQDFLTRVREELDAGLEQMDPSVSRRLQAIRRTALEQAEKKPVGLFSMPRLVPVGLFSMPRLVPVGAFATLAVAAVAMSLWFSMRQQPIPNRAADEIEVLTVQGNLEMYKDLEFFQWLAQTHEHR